MADMQPSAAAGVRRFFQHAEALCVFVLCSLFVVQAAWAASRQGATFDETAHLPAGYSYLATNDHRLNLEHPPLAKLLAALPLVVLPGVRFSTDWPEWRGGQQFPFGRRFLFVEHAPGPLLLWGRLPLVLLADLLGLAIWRWTRELAGRAAALFALGMFSFTPEFLAHGGLVTTDVPLAAFVFLAFYAAFRCTQRLTASAILACGLALGAAIASKFSALLFAPLIVLVLLARAVSAAPLTLRLGPRNSERELVRRGQRLLALGIAAATCAGLTWLVLWVAYGFDAGSSDYAAQLTSARLPDIWPVLSLAHAVGILPDAYVQGLASALAHSTMRVSFLLGRTSNYGFPFYFVITPLVKMPLPVLAAIAWGCGNGLIAALRRRPGYATLLLPAAAYYATSLQSNLNIGHRHLLPIYPFLFVLAGCAAGPLLSRTRNTALALALGAWLIVGTLRVAPNYLTYFNELAGGSRGGLSIVVDSNLDWGQGLPALKRWMNDAGVRRIYLSYFGSAMPEAYGIDYVALPSFFELTRPRVDRLDLHQAEYVAVSATNLQHAYLADSPPEFLRFLDHLREEREPEAIVAGSIYVYRLRLKARAALSTSVR